MISVRQYSTGQCLHPSVERALLIHPTEYAASGMIWIDMQSPTPEEENRVLVDWFGVNELVIEDIHRTEELTNDVAWQLHPPKAEEYPNFLFLIYRAMHIPGKIESEEPAAYIRRIRPAQVNVLLNRGVVITHHHGDITALDNVRKRVDANPHILSRGPDYLAAVVADAAVDDLFTINDLIARRLEEYEKVILRSTSNMIVVRLQRGRRLLLQYRNAITRMNEMIGRMARGNLMFVDQAEVAYFRDVHDHTIQALEQIDQLTVETNNLLELHFAMTNARLNEVMRRLTALSTIILPATFITSWYGMNFENMPELKLWFSYPLLIVIVLSLVAVLLIYFRRRGWLA